MRILKLTILNLLVLSASILQAQRERDLWYMEKYNSHTADSLVALKQYHIISFDAAILKSKCNSLIASRYGITLKKIWFGCYMPINSFFDTISAFNSKMYKALSEEFCIDWKAQFDAEVDSCNKNICEDCDSSYVQWGHSIYYKFKKDEATVTKEMQCILDLTLLNSFFEYPEMKIILNGFSSLDENNSKRLSLQKARNIKKYLISRGVDRNRIEIEGHDSLEAFENYFRGEGDISNLRVVTCRASNI